MRPSWKSLADFPFTGSPQVVDLSYLVPSLFQLLVALHSCHFSQIVGIFCYRVESSLPAASTYCFSHLWFLVVQLLCSWMFALYFMIPHCMTGRLRPSCSFQLLWSYLGCVVCPRDLWVLAFSGIPAQFPLLGLFLAYWLWWPKLVLNWIWCGKKPL